MSQPFFTQRGTEFYCVLDSLTYRILTVDPRRRGIVATIEVSFEQKPVHRDEVKLWSSESRKKFAKKCRHKAADGHLCKIEDKLKLHIQEQAAANGATAKTPDELQGRLIHPALHIEPGFSSVGIVKRENGDEKFLILTCGGNTYAAEGILDVLRPRPLAHPGLSGRRASMNTSWVDSLALLIDKVRHLVWFEDPRWYTVIPIWTAATYVFPLFPFFPYLHLTGEKGSGKTKLQDILEQTAFNAVKVVDPTPAVLFRIVHALRPTLLIDEAEKMNSDEAQEIRAIINAGYKQRATVARVEGDDRHVEFFGVYSPKCLASIQSLGTVTEDRCIAVVMSKPRQNDPKQNKWVDACDPDWEIIRGGLYDLPLKHSDQIHALLTSPALPDGMVFPDWLRARDRELWTSLLLLAAFVDSTAKLDAYDDVIGLASESVKEKGLTFEAEAIVGVLESKLNGQGALKVHPVDLVEDLEAALGRKKKGVSPEWIAGRLRSLGFKKANPPRDNRGVIYEIGAERLCEIKLRHIPLEQPTHLHNEQPPPKQPTEHKEEF